MAAKSKKDTSSSAKSTLSELADRKDYKDIHDTNTDELELKTYDKAMPDLDFGGIHFVQASIAESMIALADQMIEGIMERLGPDQSKPNIPGLFEMFDNAFNIKDRNHDGSEKRELQSYIPILKEMEQSVSGSMDELLSAKHAFEKGSHKNKTDFMLKSIKVGADIATAKVTWDFAVQNYKESKENAEATFKDDVQKAYIGEVSQADIKGASLANEIIIHKNNSSYAVKVSEAINKYGNEIAEANNGLSDAFSQLGKDLVQHWNEMIAGETDLMVENRRDSSELWQAIKASYDKLLKR